MKFYPDLAKKVLGSPIACLLLLTRARLSGIKRGEKNPDSVIHEFFASSKLQQALNDASKLSYRSALDVVEDERHDFERARSSPQEALAIAELKKFAIDLKEVAASVYPDIVNQRATV
ncbi:hypothetical protein [Pseudotabrizicola alkalilacus]|uniref:Uncharacterized protein n=1 Tax=Pseudotabrizicola alkalilacus TaxID=2305252 RepID=A0A411Z1J4_9RHOB|nr:hypothetical protein [Pseudotabrizicola alkalilacus]RGP36928.1 hypothetical protein D1012_12315 [Pseudotabrizicola alkalilacus]